MAIGKYCKVAGYVLNKNHPLVRHLKTCIRMLWYIYTYIHTVDIYSYSTLSYVYIYLYFNCAWSHGNGYMASPTAQLKEKPSSEIRSIEFTVKGTLSCIPTTDHDSSMSTHDDTKWTIAPDKAYDLLK